MSVNTALNQIGQDLTSVVLTGQTIAATGIVTDSVTVVTATAFTDDLDAQITRVLEEITPINASEENFVKIINGFSFAVTLIKINAGAGAQTDPNPVLTGVLAGFDYWKLVYINGVAGGSQETVTIYGIINNIGEGVHGKGRQTSPCTFNSVSVSGAAISFTRVVA